jgi:two-component system, OmpR family, alkaline phosphatase synthesis response regulator PhoP
MQRILVVEDDPDIVELLTHYLERDGFQVIAVADGRRALDVLRSEPPSLMLLDLQLPSLDGLSVCREARLDPLLREIPIIILTARGEETDRVVGLELGADDYVVKPFSPKELMARVRAVLRRSARAGSESDGPLRLGDLTIDRARHVARWRGEAVHLTAKEFALLLALVDAHGRVLSRQQLLEGIWGYSYAEGTRTVDVHIRRLREKVPGLADSIVTVKGLGYRFSLDREGR